MAYPTDIGGIIGIWVGLFLTIAIYSYQLYKETPLYRLAEHIYLGIAFAIVGITAVETTMKVAVNPLMDGKLVYLIPIALGFMMYTIFSDKYRWMSRYSVGTLVGVSLGVRVVALLVPRLLNQVIATITPPTTHAAIDWLNFVFVSIGTICALSYFLLTHEHEKQLKIPTQIGRWLIMIGLGAMFGNTVLFRMAMLSGRVEYIMKVLRLIPM